MNPAKSRRLKHERHEQTGAPLPVNRNGRHVGTCYRAHGRRTWSAYLTDGTQVANAMTIEKAERAVWEAAAAKEAVR